VEQHLQPILLHSLQNFRAFICIPIYCSVSEFKITDVTLSRIQSTDYTEIWRKKYTVELGYNDIEGTETFVSLQPSIAVSEVYSKSDGKIFQDKIQACRHMT
jgi:hypothetical protein